MSPSKSPLPPQAGPAQPPLAGAMVPLCLSSTQDVLDLIADLKTALRRSRRTGGSQLVYRRDGQGRSLLLVEIHLPFGERTAP